MKNSQPSPVAPDQGVAQMQETQVMKILENLMPIDPFKERVIRFKRETTDPSLSDDPMPNFQTELDGEVRVSRSAIVETLVEALRMCFNSTLTQTSCLPDHLRIPLSSEWLLPGTEVDIDLSQDINLRSNTTWAEMFLEQLSGKVPMLDDDLEATVDEFMRAFRAKIENTIDQSDVYILFPTESNMMCFRRGEQPHSLVFSSV